MNIRTAYIALCLTVAATCSLHGADVKSIPTKYADDATQAGYIDTLKYSVYKAGQEIEKEALVYLPYGYDESDESTRYNVLYLAHGGGDIPGSFFSEERTPYPLNKVADHLIEDGLMNPIIIVSASYYLPIDKDDNRGMDSTISYVKNFNKEVRQCLIPAVGKKYNTYLRSLDDDAITATREHRAYGGFSMGALSTWYQLAYDADAFSQFLPLSGDLWVYDEQGNKESASDAAKWLNDRLMSNRYRGREINVLAYSGTDDIAYVPELNFIEAVKALAPILEYSDDYETGNLHFGVQEGGVHNYEFISQYLMDAMPRLWQE